MDCYSCEKFREPNNCAHFDGKLIKILPEEGCSYYKELDDNFYIN